MRRLALAVLITGLVACGGSSGSGSVEADASSGRVSTEMRDAQRFVPNRFVKVKPGAQVTVELKNTGAIAHSFLSPELRVTEAVKVDAGKTGSVAFTAPAAAGTYKFACNEPGHAEAGMTGEVVVQ